MTWTCMFLDGCGTRVFGGNMQRQRPSVCLGIKMVTFMLWGDNCVAPRNQTIHYTLIVQVFGLWGKPEYLENMKITKSTLLPNGTITIVSIVHFVIKAPNLVQTLINICWRNGYGASANVYSDNCGSQWLLAWDVLPTLQLLFRVFSTIHVIQRRFKVGKSFITMFQNRLNTCGHWGQFWICDVVMYWAKPSHYITIQWEARTSTRCICTPADLEKLIMESLKVTRCGQVTKDFNLRFESHHAWSTSEQGTIFSKCFIPKGRINPSD